MILIDSSAWVEYDRATGSPADARVGELLGARRARDAAVTEPVVMEVIAGARDDRCEADLRRLLERCSLLRFDAAVDFAGASRIYRACRRAGVTPRGMVDCMIAAVALRYQATLLAHDADLAHMAPVLGLTLDPASLVV